MPTYDYRCEACEHTLELFQKITESPKKKCPACGKSKLKRLIGGGAGFLFKGSGFYLTDYRSDSYKAAEKSDSASPAPASEAKSDTKGAAKSETKSESSAPKPSAKSPKKKSDG
ncbi:MAG: zinc ribbon domain-containing protein [Planctomycetota bacterium]